MRRSDGLAATAAAVAALGVASVCLAQVAETASPLTVVVGSPQGAAVMDRLDTRRSNRGTSPLPRQSLRILWSRHLHRASHPPLVLLDGAVVAIADDGDTLVLNADGTDRARLTLGPGPLSAAALLSDGTFTAFNGAGDAVGVQRGTIRWRTHLIDPPPGAERRPRSLGRGRHRLAAMDPETESGAVASPLPLDDGGVVMALDRELFCLDSLGSVRARAATPDAVGYPLLGTGRSVVMVAEDGDVLTWTPGDTVHKRGSFGVPIDGAATLDTADSILGVTGSRVMALNLMTGALTERGSSGRGVFVGPASLTGDGLMIQELTPTGTRAVHLAPDGQAEVVATLSPQGAVPAADGGVLLLMAPTHTALLTDPSGAIAYGTVDGRVGVASPGEKTELGEFVCGRPPPPSTDPFRQGARASAGFVGIVPAGARAFVVACEDGNVALIRGE
jgi:hypothetical protein